jgi:hypothetical protein
MPERASLRRCAVMTMVDSWVVAPLLSAAGAAASALLAPVPAGASAAQTGGAASSPVDSNVVRNVAPRATAEIRRMTMIHSA